MAGVLCVIDREDPDNLLKQNSIRYSSLFTHGEFEEFISRNILPRKLVKCLA